MKRTMGLFVLAATLLAPGAAFSAEKRYYDRDKKDYHEWNEGENKAYRHWLMEERKEKAYRDYNRISKERQREYWRWRHEHSDWR